MADGRHHLAALGHLSGDHGVVGEGGLGHRRRRGLEHGDLEFAPQPVDRLDAGVHLFGSSIIRAKQ